MNIYFLVEGKRTEKKVYPMHYKAVLFHKKSIRRSLIFIFSFFILIRTMNAQSLTVTVIDENEVATPEATVLFYENGNHQSKTTDSEGVAYFETVSRGNHYIEAYHNANDPFDAGEGLWTAQNITIEAGNNQIVLQRAYPFLTSFRMFNSFDNTLIQQGDEIPLGTEIRLEVNVHNATPTTRNVSVKSVLDHEKQDPWDCEQLIDFLPIAPNDTRVYCFVFTPQQAGDTFFSYYITDSEVGKTGAGNWQKIMLVNEQPLKQETRTLEFSGLRWQVKNGYHLPGRNLWSSSEQNVRLDEQERLHLKITHACGMWYCAEIVSEQQFGYGEYTFQVESRIDTLDPNAVLGLFNHQVIDNQNTPQEYEIDIEFSTWKNQIAPRNSQYVFQYRPAGNANTPNQITPHRFEMKLNDTKTTHKFLWESGKITFQSYRGFHWQLPSDSDLLTPIFTYNDWRVPPEDQQRLHLNLWLYQALPPEKMKEIEVIIKAVRFTPLEKVGIRKNESMRNQSLCTVKPNVSDGNFYLKTNTEQRLRLAVYDTLGKVVYKQTIQTKKNASYHINLSHCTGGVYRLLIISEQRRESIPLIIKK